jgi:hypothetical protein
MLETHIEACPSHLLLVARFRQGFFLKILKETQLRDDSLHLFANRARAVCLRRRRHSPIRLDLKIKLVKLQRAICNEKEDCLYVCGVARPNCYRIPFCFIL